MTNTKSIRANRVEHSTLPTTAVEKSRNDRELQVLEERLGEISSSIVIPPPFTSPTNTSAGTDSERISEHHESQLHEEQIPAKRSSVRNTAHQLARSLFKYLQTPLGIVVGIYGLLVIVWGAALVIIIVGWTPMTPHTKDIWVEICSQVLNGLFTVTGIGFIPWRVRDAWHMSVITRYRRKIAKLVRRRRRRTQISIESGIGATPVRNTSKLDSTEDIEEPGSTYNYLNDNEMQRLLHSEERFMASQKWYKSEETALNKIFPAGLALTITCLVVGNSVFQCFLCGIMWGLDRHTRPPWTTGLLIGLSFSCGVTAAVLIWWGSKKIRKTQA